MAKRDLVATTSVLLSLHKKTGALFSQAGTDPQAGTPAASELSKRHCQLSATRANLSQRSAVAVAAAQAHVTRCHARKERSRSSRWFAELTGCRPTRKRFRTTP